MIFELEIASSYSRPLHFKAAERLAVPRQALVFVVGDLHLDGEEAKALFRLEIEERIAFEVGDFVFHRAERTDRAHFRHAPGMEDFDVVILLECLDHGARTCRAADHHAFQIAAA